MKQTIIGAIIGAVVTMLAVAISPILFSYLSYTDVRSDRVDKEMAYFADRIRSEIAESRYRQSDLVKRLEILELRQRNLDEFVNSLKENVELTQQLVNELNNKMTKDQR